MRPIPLDWFDIQTWKDWRIGLYAEPKYVPNDEDDHAIQCALDDAKKFRSLIKFMPEVHYPPIINMVISRCYSPCLTIRLLIPSPHQYVWCAMGLKQCEVGISKPARNNLEMVAFRFLMLICRVFVLLIVSFRDIQEAVSTNLWFPICSTIRFSMTCEFPICCSNWLRRLLRQILDCITLITLDSDSFGSGSVVNFNELRSEIVCWAWQKDPCHSRRSLLSVSSHLKWIYMY